MSDLNYYAMANALGAKIKPVKQARFGNFGLLATTAEGLRAQNEGKPEKRRFSLEEDRLIVQAFENVRQGAAMDAVLTDKCLAEAFVRQCRELGVAAQPALLTRRIVTIRKNIRRYEEHGITISPATRIEPQPSIVPLYAPAIEFALVRLRFRYGISIDDILLDPGLGEQFESLARQAAPDLTSQQLRLGALYIRKTRKNLGGIDAIKAKVLDVDAFEREMSNAVSLARLRPGSVPAGPGILEVKEPSRYLYIAQNNDLRPAVEQLRTGRAFELVATGFWKPQLEAITVQFVADNKLEGIAVGLWARRLIHDRQPVFNWPIHGMVA